MTKIHTKLCSCNLFRKPNIFSIWNNKEIIGKSYRSPSGPGENTYMARNLTSSGRPLRPIFRLWFLMMASPTYNDHLDYFSINGFYSTLHALKFRAVPRYTKANHSLKNSSRSSTASSLKVSLWIASSSFALAAYGGIFYDGYPDENDSIDGPIWVNMPWYLDCSCKIGRENDLIIH